MSLDVVDNLPIPAYVELEFLMMLGRNGPSCRILEHLVAEASLQASDDHAVILALKYAFGKRLKTPRE